MPVSRVVSGHPLGATAERGRNGLRSVPSCIHRIDRRHRRCNRSRASTLVVSGVIGLKVAGAAGPERHGKRHARTPRGAIHHRQGRLLALRGAGELGCRGRPFVRLAVAAKVVQLLLFDVGEDLRRPSRPAAACRSRGRGRPPNTSPSRWSERTCSSARAAASPGQAASDCSSTAPFWPPRGRLAPPAASSAIKMPMIVITTNNSTSVKPFLSDARLMFAPFARACRCLPDGNILLRENSEHRPATAGGVILRSCPIGPCWRRQPLRRCGCTCTRTS